MKKAGLLGMILVALAQAQTATEVVLHNFAPQTGYYPNGVIRDSAGNIYGSTVGGGNGVERSGWGTIYKLDSAGHYTVLHSFTYGPSGHGPSAVSRDAAGNLYGTTPRGGAGSVGNVFKLDTAGTLTILFEFSGADGNGPDGVILDPAGNLYGTTSGGNRLGVIYKLDPADQETGLYRFTGGDDGGLPTGVALDAAGNLYGATAYDGEWGYGTVYKLSPAGQFTLLYSFTNGADGGNPSSDMTLDPAGNLYGTTTGGGTANAGVVYKVSQSGQETVDRKSTRL